MNIKLTNQCAAILTLMAVLKWVSVSAAQSYSVIKSLGDAAAVTGGSPEGGLTQGPDGTLYGTASGGEGSVRGIVFRINSDGTGFAPVKLFTNNLEGGNPYGGLVLSGGTLYGTTTSGGSNFLGTIFKVNTNGSGYTVLKHLSDSTGKEPLASMTLSGGTLYGTMKEGGSDDDGTLFKINTDGSGYVVLKNFSSGNDDGFNPLARLVEAGGTLYGTTYEGGTNGGGTVFKVNTDGNSYTVLVNFAFTPDGSGPSAGLMLSGSTLYGTTQNGGTEGGGTVFKVNTNGSGYAVLKSFGDISNDGLSPHGGLVLSGDSLYGTTYSGGASERGTVFKVGTNGSGYAVLKSFLLSDGSAPATDLTLSGSTVFGTARHGGDADVGTVFKINTSGSSFAVLKHFAPHSGEGTAPYGGVTLSGSTLFGAAVYGGTNGAGTIFAVNTDGSGFTLLKQFPALVSDINSDGANPYGQLVLSSNTLYGTAFDGGGFGSGTVFKLSTNGSGFTVHKHFSALNNDTNNSGAHPVAGLTLSSNTLYGTATAGGSSGNGSVFKVNTDGGSFTVLKHFSPLVNFITNSDGAYPDAGVILSGTVLYGVADEGGPIDGIGTIYKVNSDGTDFTVLHSFVGFPGDGEYPIGDLTLAGATLYGTTYNGGSAGAGTVFKVDTNGSGYALVKEFSGAAFDGANPRSALVLSGSTLYGATHLGGPNQLGTVFKVNTNGADFTVLKYFNGPDGAYPGNHLTLSGTTLYGTTTEGGALGLGTVYKIELAAVSAPLLSISRSNLSVVISWPWPSTGFVLQQNVTIITTNWTTVANTISNDGFFNWVVVPASSGTQFYRLKY